MHLNKRTRGKNSKRDPYMDKELLTTSEIKKFIDGRSKDKLKLSLVRDVKDNRYSFYRYLANKKKP